MVSGVLLSLPIASRSAAPRDEEEQSSLEAGFHSTRKTHLRFSLQFIYLMLVFVLFDTEVLLVFGLIIGSLSGVVVGVGLAFFLFLTLLLE